MKVELEKQFDFNESELLSNHNGQLSEKQIRLLSEYRRLGRFFRRAAWIGVFSSVGGISSVTVYNTGIDLQKRPDEALVQAVFISVSLLTFGFSMVLGKFRSDLQSGKISTVEGYAVKKEKKIKHNFPMAYYLTIGNVRFQLDGREKYQAISPNTYYRIYYIKHLSAHLILSVSEIPARCADHKK